MKQTVGRPSKITKEVLAKLEDAFALGHSDEEACLIAEIDEATLYRYCKKNPTFASKKELLKQKPKIIARRIIVQAIKNGDVALSRWYLERKAKGEFNPPEKVDPTSERVQVVGINYIVPRESAKKFLEEHGMKNVKTR